MSEQRRRGADRARPLEPLLRLPPLGSEWRVLTRSACFVSRNFRGVSFLFFSLFFSLSFSFLFFSFLFFFFCVLILFFLSAPPPEIARAGDSRSTVDSMPSPTLVKSLLRGALQSGRVVQRRSVSRPIARAAAINPRRRAARPPAGLISLLRAGPATATAPPPSSPTACHGPRPAACRTPVGACRIPHAIALPSLAVRPPTSRRSDTALRLLPDAGGPATLQPAAACAAHPIPSSARLSPLHGAPSPRAPCTLRTPFRPPTRTAQCSTAGPRLRHPCRALPIGGRTDCLGAALDSERCRRVGVVVGAASRLALFSRRRPAASACCLPACCCCTCPSSSPAPQPIRARPRQQTAAEAEQSINLAVCRPPPAVRLTGWLPPPRRSLPASRPRCHFSSLCCCPISRRRPCGCFGLPAAPRPIPRCWLRSSRSRGSRVCSPTLFPARSLSVRSCLSPTLSSSAVSRSFFSARFCSAVVAPCRHATGWSLVSSAISPPLARPVVRKPPR